MVNHGGFRFDHNFLKWFINSNQTGNDLFEGRQLTSIKMKKKTNDINQKFGISSYTVRKHDK